MSKMFTFPYHCTVHQNLPESNRSMMDERIKQTALVMEVLKQAAETNENLARGSWPSQK